MSWVAGKLLEVDLTAGRIQSHEIDPETLANVLGGRGLNAWVLARELRPGVDALGPDNVLVLSAGLLTGSQAPSSARLHVGALSPLTDLLGSSNVGGHFGAELQATGLMALVIRGRAARPSVLWVADGSAEIREAVSLWGQDTVAATQALREQAGDGTRCLVIGPAGENLVRYACIITDTRHAAGRTGMGAVMGSKNLKAIVVRGRRDRACATAVVTHAVKEYAARIRSAPRFESYARFSNSNFVNWANDAGLLATHNYQRVHFDGAARIDGSELIRYVKKPKSCYRCPVHCKAEIEINEGRYKGTRGERPDIEPIVNFGSKCGLDDPEALMYLHNLTGTLGLDSISTAGVLAFVMELRERGILSDADTGEIRLDWGNADAMEQMIRLIARREGLGAVLAEGVRRAARTIGRGSQSYAHHSKGLELTAYDARGGMGTALGYAISNRGADFTSVYPVPEYRWTPEQGRDSFGSEGSVDRLSTEGKGALVRRTMIVSAALDALGLCKVPVLSIVGDYSLQNEAALAAAVTGLNLDADDLSLVGERIVTLEKALNVRLGAGRGDDDLPDRFTEEPVPDEGPTQGMTVDIQRLVDDFYRAMGWDTGGRPTPDRLRELGLDELLS